MGLKSYIAERREKKASLPSKENVPGSRVYVRGGWTPGSVRGDYTLGNSEMIFSAVSRISNTLSAMPVQLFKGANPQKNALNDLISFEPNPNMTSVQFFKTLEACRCTSGNCYAIKVSDANGNLARIDIIDPTRIKPILDTDSGELWYRVSPEKKAEFYVHNYHIMHVPFISANGYSGVNPVLVLNDTLQYADNIATFSVKQLKEGVNARVALEAPAHLNDDQRVEMLDSFTKTYKETSGDILLLESGVQAKTLNMSPVDGKIFDVEKITRSKVALVYNIPPHMLGDYSDMQLSSQEQIMLEFLTMTMLPIVTAYEAELNRKFLTKDQRKNGYRFQFNMDAVLRADAATMAEVNYKAVRSAWKTPDEIRKTYNLPPYPEKIGNHPMISQDMATLDYTVNQKPAVLAGTLLPEKGQEDEKDGES